MKTIKTSFMGTLNMLGLAKRTKARFLISSTSGTRSDVPCRTLFMSVCQKSTVTRRFTLSKRTSESFISSSHWLH